MSTPGNFDHIFQTRMNQIYQNPQNLQADVQQFINLYLDFAQQIVDNIAKIIQQTQINDKKIIWYYILDISMKMYTENFKKYIKQLHGIFVDDLVNSIEQKQFQFFRNLVKVVLSWDGGYISFNFLNNVFKEFQNRKKEIDILDYLTKDDIQMTQQHYKSSGIEGKMLNILKKISKIKKDQNYSQKEENKKKKVSNNEGQIVHKKMKTQTIVENGTSENEQQLAELLLQDFFQKEKKLSKIRYLSQQDFETLLQQQDSLQSSSSLKKLYSSLDYLCPNCGISLECKEKLDFHLDQHYRKNFKQSQNIQLSKKKFLNKVEFLNSYKFIASKDEQKQKKQKQSLIVSYKNLSTQDMNDNKCSICGFNINIFYDTNFNDWFYKNAVLLEKENQTYKVHQSCYQKLEKQMNNLEEGSIAEEV